MSVTLQLQAFGRGDHRNSADFFYATVGCPADTAAAYLRAIARRWRPAA